jgi:ABC-type transporter Mla subunit MlaD
MPDDLTIAVGRKFRVQWAPVDPTEQSQGFSGRNYLSLSDGNPDAPLLKPEGGRLPTVRAQAGGISAIVDKAPEIADRVLKVADQTSSLVGGGQSQDLGAIVSDLRALTETLASRDQEIGRMIVDLRGRLGLDPARRGRGPDPGRG